jgi:SAM-dependent methyltransferase
LVIVGRSGPYLHEIFCAKDLAGIIFPPDPSLGRTVFDLGFLVRWVPGKMTSSDVLGLTAIAGERPTVCAPAPVVSEAPTAPPRATGMRARIGTLGYGFHRIGLTIGLKYGGSFFFPSEDRTVLENQILPFYQLSRTHNDILFVGTEWYTHGYVRMFSHKSFTTLDVGARKARYGASRHITENVTRLDWHFGPGTLDVIFLNGIIGWGLDNLSDAEKVIALCHKCLRPGGHLILGWNDLAANRPFRLDEIESLTRFRPFIFPQLQSSEHLIDNGWRHVFSFFEA